MVIADTLTTLIISSAIGLVLSARLANRIRRLTSATVRVAAGDFEWRVEVRTNDDLGLLAHNFNQMVTSLHHQRTALEQRSAEIAESLCRQQQLTEDLLRGKQAEEAATRARFAAEAASQAKSMFLATMSHELRTPLTAILGYTQLLRMRAVRQQPDMVPELERLRAARKHLLTIISNILDFSKIEQGRMEVDITPFQVSNYYVRCINKSSRKSRTENRTDPFCSLFLIFYLISTRALIPARRPACESSESRTR